MNSETKIRSLRLSPIVTRQLVLLFLVSLLVAGLGWGVFAYWSYQTGLESEKNEVSNDIHPIKNAVDYQLSRRWSRLTALSVFVKTYPDIDSIDDDFRTFASGLLAYNPGIRHVNIAPKGVIRYVYPLEGNTQIVGNDLMNDKREEVRDAVKRTIETKTMNLEGPFELMVGGKGMVVREAVFNEDGSLNALVSLVFVISQLSTDVDLNNQASGLKVAVTKSDNTVVIGNENALEGEPIVEEISVPGSTWFIKAVPDEGWTKKTIDGVKNQWIVAGILAILTAALAAGLMERQLFLGRAVSDTTSDLVEANEELRRLNRFYSTLSGVNEAITVIDEPDLLMSEICRIAVERGGFVMSWIGLVDNGTNRVKPVASAGKTEGYLDAIKISVLDVPEGQSPAGTAIRKGKTVVVNDIQTNKGMRLWQKEITKRGYVSAAAIPLRSKKAIGGAFMVYDKEVNVFGKDEIALLEEIASDISLGLDKLEVEKQFLAQQKTLEKNYTIMRSSLEGTVKAIATLAEHKDPYTVGHENRVVTLALALGEELGLDKDRLEGLKIAATLHDVGKMYVPAEILSKPGRLTPLEFSMIQVHPNYSHDVLSKIEFPWPVARIALEHHERYDGSGYPQGKKGDAVLLESRILAVADVVEAMASHRPYRPALPLSAALEEIAKNKGKLYDPDVADALKRLFDNGYELPKP